MWPSFRRRGSRRAAERYADDSGPDKLGLKTHKSTVGTLCLLHARARWPRRKPNPVFGTHLGLTLPKSQTKTPDLRGF
jgi:hypothetical protein